MRAPPRFGSLAEHVSKVADAGFWRPYVAEILGRHGMAGEPRVTSGATHPTFVCDEVVVKLFGEAAFWRRSFEAERAAYGALAADPGIAAPLLLAEGALFEDVEAPWPYLVMSRTPGKSWWRARIPYEVRRTVAGDLGRLVGRLRALPVSGLATEADWPAPDLAEALRRSSLPSHLAAQAEAFVAGAPPTPPVFVHQDIVGNHVMVENGRLAGLIDWGDAIAGDPYLELIQPHRDMFGCDKGLLRAFLEGAGWTPPEDFARRALAAGLRRQAIGLGQHHSMDVFEPVAQRIPLSEIESLEALAALLFEV